MAAPRTRLSLAARSLMRRPQNRVDYRYEMNCTPMLGSGGAGSNAPLVVTWTS